MRLYLLRHAETVGNATRVIQHPHTPLSERGMVQAACLADRLRDAGIAGVLSSDHARARATAEALAAATGAPLAIDPDLAERSFGDLRGVAYADLDFDPFAPDYVPPGGESWEAFHARVDRVWPRVLATASTTPGDLAVVTHGLVCLSVVARLADLSPGMEVPRTWGNTAVTILEGTPPRRVTLLDCTRHLAERSAGGVA